MTRFGQCPACHSTYALDDEDVGHVAQCECGQVLVACDAGAVQEIPVVCHACGAEYEAEPADAGQRVECDCGQSILVPDVVLRKPIGELADLDDQLPIDGGDDAPLAVATSVSVTETSEAAAQKSARDHHADKEGISWFSVIGVGSVVVLLVVSVVMFLFREQPASVSRETKAIQRTVTKVVPPEAMAQRSSVAPDASPTESELADVFEGPRPQRAAPTIASTMDSTALADPLVSSASGPALDQDKNRKVISQQVADRLAFPIPPAPLYALPKAKPARRPIPIVATQLPRMTLTTAVEKGFQAYEQTMRLKEAAEASKEPADVEKYHRQLGATIARLQQVHDLAVAKSDHQQVTNTRYLLAYLMYTAGHLPEASIMGQAVARWGEKDEPSTKEAAMIALAAAQEASETHWGQAEQVGELDQMQTVATVIAERWPDDPQLDLIWMNLGYLYEAFNFPVKAVEVYARIPPQSKQFATAQLAAGNAVWTIARRQALDTDRDIDQTLRERARQQLERGIDALEKNQAEPSEQSISARLSLAQIELIAGNAAEAEQWLAGSEPSAVDSVRVAGRASENGVEVSEATARLVFNAAFTACQQLGDELGAKSVLEKMRQTLGLSSQQTDAKLLSVVTKAIARLQASSDVFDEDVTYLSDLAQPLIQNEAALTSANLLWMGEAWSKLGKRAADSQVAKDCAAEAARLYQQAMQRSDFPATSLQSARLRRIQLLRDSGDVLEALEMIERVLKQSPNVFALQIEAAQSLQQLGVESGDVSKWRSAVDGPGEGSPIWGWAKLVTTLYAARWSQEGTETHIEQLSGAQYNLARCRFGIANSSRDPQSRQSQIAELERSVRKLLATMDPGNQPWHGRLQQLQSELKQAMR